MFLDCAIDFAGVFSARTVCSSGLLFLKFAIAFGQRQAPACRKGHRVAKKARKIVFTGVGFFKVLYDLLFSLCHLVDRLREISKVSSESVGLFTKELAATGQGGALDKEVIGDGCNIQCVFIKGGRKRGGLSPDERHSE